MGRYVGKWLIIVKRFILYVNQQYLPMAQDLTRCRFQLYSCEGTAETATRLFQADVKIRIEGPPEHQVRLMCNHVKKHDKQRWKALMALWGKDNCENVLQTKGHLQAVSLLLRLNTALLGDFLSLKRQVRVGTHQIDLFVNLGENRKESKRLIHDAVSSHRVLQQAEGNLFVAQLCALERQNVTEPTQAESPLQEGTVAIEEAQRLCNLHPGQTRGLAEEIEGTRGMWSDILRPSDPRGAQGCPGRNGARVPGDRTLVLLRKWTSIHDWRVWWFYAIIQMSRVWIACGWSSSSNDHWGDPCS